VHIAANDLGLELARSRVPTKHNVDPIGEPSPPGRTGLVDRDPRSCFRPIQLHVLVVVTLIDVERGVVKNLGRESRAERRPRTCTRPPADDAEHPAPEAAEGNARRRTAIICTNRA
jgi:hypothetical protein